MYLMRMWYIFETPLSQKYEDVLGQKGQKRDKNKTLGGYTEDVKRTKKGQKKDKKRTKKGQYLNIYI